MTRPCGSYLGPPDLMGPLVGRMMSFERRSTYTYEATGEAPRATSAGVRVPGAGTTTTGAGSTTTAGGLTMMPGWTWASSGVLTAKPRAMAPMKVFMTVLLFEGGDEGRLAPAPCLFHERNATT